MKTICTRFLILIALAVTWVARADDTLARREWKVDGVTREALVHIPAMAKTNAAPVVFAFHGHGGSMRNAARMFGYHTEWPETIVVYMQGLNTPGKLTDPEGKKPGWQHGLGAENDRDLKFFDVVLASLKKENKVDAKRIYATGHSNGGGFSYLLWEARGKEFAAFAPSAALARSLVENKTIANTNSISGNRAFFPKPVLHVAGEKDSLVKFSWQKLMMEALRKHNQCGAGKSWGNENGCTIYESKVDAPVVTYIHSGTHKFPAEAPALIVKFFKEHAQK